MPFDDAGGNNYQDQSTDWNEPIYQKQHEQRLSVTLELTDPTVVSAINSQPRGPERDQFIARALRIGVLAINQAAGQIDTDVLRDEGGRLVEKLSGLIEGYRERTNNELEGVLRDYFNPEDGRFTQNVERLVRQDGDLQQVLRAHMEASQNGIRQTITQLIGEDSPIMRLLSPDDANTFFTHMTTVTNQVIETQNHKILQQFSLDAPDSALNRIVRELNDNHARVGSNLQEHISTVMKEFSLDEEDGALNRMLRQIRTANEQIQSEFTLDNDSSALARMRREIRQLIEDQNRAAQEFQLNVTAAITALTARKEEARRGVQHGNAFEEAVISALKFLSDGSGDEVEAVGMTTGEIPRSKVGDAVITLSDDSVAPGARIVVEAKEAENYTLSEIRKEMAAARENRKATYGIFVLSADTALANEIRPLQRYENDILVVWNAEDRSTDIVLQAAVLMAKGLVVRAAKEKEGMAADIEAMDRSLATILRQLEGFEEINTSANTIKNGAVKILDRSRIMRDSLEKELETLDAELLSLRQQRN